MWLFRNVTKSLSAVYCSCQSWGQTQAPPLSSFEFMYVTFEIFLEFFVRCMYNFHPLIWRGGVCPIVEHIKIGDVYLCTRVPTRAYQDIISFVCDLCWAKKIYENFNLWMRLIDKFYFTEKHKRGRVRYLDFNHINQGPIICWF